MEWMLLVLYMYMYLCIPFKLLNTPPACIIFHIYFIKLIPDTVLFIYTSNQTYIHLWCYRNLIGVKLQMQTLFYFLNLLDSLCIVLCVFSGELIAHLNKGQAEFFWCKNMFHRPLFYIVSLYTCVTLSDFLIHKKFIFKLTKAPLQTIKKTIFSYITVTTSIWKC